MSATGGQRLTASRMGTRRRWHRVAQYQKVSLKLIAEGVLSGCPSISKEDLSQGLFFPGELECAKLRLEKPVTLVVSKHNPGAAGLADELASAFTGITIRPASVEKQRRRSLSRKFSWQGDLASPMSEKWLFLLYLNERTFIDDAGELLAEQVRAVHEQDTRSILLVHENDAALGGCEFSRCYCTQFKAWLAWQSILSSRASTCRGAVCFLHAVRYRTACPHSGLVFCHVAGSFKAHQVTSSPVASTRKWPSRSMSNPSAK